MKTLTLTDRLLGFFLGTMAAVLVGFSASIYAVASADLRRQTDDKLASALDTLAAAAEVKPEGIEWEPHERTVSLGDGPMGGRIAFSVLDDRGRVIDHSTPDPARDGWRTARRWLRAENPAATAVEVNPGEVMYPGIELVAELSPEPVRAALNRLALGLTGLSVLVWLVVLGTGRWICRRALAPLTRVAASAESMGIADPAARLPGTGAGDELDGLVGSFNGLLTRLHESFDRQQRFTGDASHQLRTPLTAILGQIEVALRRPRDADEYRRVLASVQRQSTHLHRIVESLLFLARADADARLPGLERLDLAAWLTTHLEGWNGHPRAADLRNLAASGPMWVSAHPLLLAELLDNLLDNAVKYSDAGTTVALGLDGGEGGATLSVTDLGCGIADGERAHLFEAFYRSPESRRRGIAGVGLGLTIAARLAAAMAARIEVSGRAGGGSRFAVVLRKA